MKIRDQQHVTLVGGDQVTVARIHDTQRICGNVGISQRLDRILPFAEDWHAKMCFLEVI